MEKLIEKHEEAIYTTSKLHKQAIQCANITAEVAIKYLHWSMIRAGLLNTDYDDLSEDAKTTTQQLFTLYLTTLK